MPLDPQEVLVEGLKAVAAGFTAFGAWVVGTRRGRKQAALEDPGLASELLKQKHSVDLLEARVKRNEDTLNDIDERVDRVEQARVEDVADVRMALELLREIRRGGSS